MTIGECIHELRKEHKLSQYQFAKMIGVAQSSVNYWEKGRMQPKFEQLKKIADAFNIPISSLVDIDTNIKENAKLLNINENDLVKTRYTEASEFIEFFFNVYLNLTTTEQAFFAHSMKFVLKEITNTYGNDRKELLSLLNEFLLSFTNLILLNKNRDGDVKTEDIDACIYHTKIILSIPFKINELYNTNNHNKPDTDK